MFDVILGLERHDAALSGLARLLRESTHIERPADIAALIESLVRDHSVLVEELREMEE